MNNARMVDAVAEEPASCRGFRGCMGFAVHAVACVALLFAGPLSPAEAQTTRTWNTSVTTGAWSNANSWDGGTVPSATTDIAAFTSTNPSLTLTATGNATPNIGQLYFDNAGTTTLQVNKITLNSGTGILVTANSGNVFINNTHVPPGGNRDGAVIVSTNQTWRNDSTTSGTLSVQATSGNIYLGNPGTSPATLTLSGAGAIHLGEIRSLEAGSTVIYQGSNVLTLAGARATNNNNNFNFTLRSGTVATALASAAFGTGTTTISGGAIHQVGTGTSDTQLLVNNSFSLVSGSLTFGNTNGSSMFSTGTSDVTLTVSDGAQLLSLRQGFRGTSQITKAGPGTLVLSQASGTSVSGTFSGGFRMEAGLLVVQNRDSASNIGANPLGTGTFTIAGGTISAGIGQSAALSMPSRFENNFSVGGTAAFNLGSGTVTLTTTPTINVVNSAVTFTIGGPIVGGANGLTKSGPGQMTLTGSSTYTGLTTVSSGTLQLGNNGTTGSVDGDIANNAMLVFNRSNAQTYGGVISGSGNLTKIGSTSASNLLTLNGANTFSGTTTVSNGVISLGNALALQNSGINTAGAGTITAPSPQTSLTIGGLIGSKNFSSVFDTTNLNVTSVTLNPQAGRSYTYSGTIANVGTRTLTKTGAGEQILSAVNTYTGLTTVSAGRLTIGGGNINASSGVTVNGADAEFRYNSATAFNKTLTLTQGILSGTGTIQTAVTVGANAIISPGNSPGSQTYDSSVWQAGGTYLWELNAQTGTAGTNWDRVVVTNALNLTALSASSKFNINLTTLTGSNTNGPLDTPWVATGTSIFPFVSYNTLSVSGSFSNAANSDLTALFNFNLDNWVGTPKPQASDISVKVNSNGNGLNLVIVPEPATIALAGIGIGSAVWFFRRRRAT